jgi:hypothetical protein
MRNNWAAKNREQVHSHTRRRRLRILGESWKQCHSLVIPVFADHYVLVHLNNHEQCTGAFVKSGRTTWLILVIQDVTRVSIADVGMSGQLDWQFMTSAWEDHDSLSFGQGLFWKEMDNHPLLASFKVNSIDEADTCINHFLSAIRRTGRPQYDGIVFAHRYSLNYPLLRTIRPNLPLFKLPFTIDALQEAAQCLSYPKAPSLLGSAVRVWKREV